MCNWDLVFEEGVCHVTCSVYWDFTDAPALENVIEKSNDNLNQIRGRGNATQPKIIFVGIVRGNGLKIQSNDKNSKFTVPK